MDDQSELQKKVEEMEAFLGKILAFANSFIRKNGRVVSRDSGSHWSEVVYALDSFGGFNFHWSSGGQGSSTFDVVEHPSRRRLLSFSYWRDASDSQISIFCKNGSDWQARLCQTIENADALLAEKMAKQAQDVRDAELSRHQKVQQEELKAKAKRLGLL